MTINYSSDSGKYKAKSGWAEEQSTERAPAQPHHATVARARKIFAAPLTIGLTPSLLLHSAGDGFRARTAHILTLILPAHMLPRLVATNPFCPKREFVLDHFPVTLGRGQDAEICVHDRWVSRYHCIIEHTGNRLLIRDLGSKHGLFVNGHRVSQAELSPGDWFTVGVTSFIANYEDATNESSTTSQSGNDSRKIRP